MQQTAKMAEVLLDFHCALLQSSALTPAQQLALNISVQQLFRLEEVSRAVHLLLAGTASCAIASPLLQEHMDSLIHSGLLHELLNVLDQLQPCSAAVPLLLRCICKLASTTATKQLHAIWSNQQNRTRVLAAACTSTEAAEAAASLLLLAATKGLEPGQCLKQLLLMQGNTHSSTSPSNSSLPAANAQKWAATAMQQLLQQLLQQICSWNVDPAAAAAAAPLLLTPEQQQLWLLLCSCVDVAHAAATGCALNPLHMFFSNTAVISVFQVALSSHPASGVRAASLQLVSTLSALSVPLARCCLKAVAPVITQLLQPFSSRGGSSSSSSSSSSIAGDGNASQQLVEEQAAAAANVWQQLLQRVRSSCRKELSELVADQMQAVAAAVASLAPSVAAVSTTAASVSSIDNNSLLNISSGDSSKAYNMDCSRQSNRHFSSVSAKVAVFQPVASSISCHTKPLLPDQPHLVAEALLPHTQPLIQLVSSVAAPTAATAATASSSTAAASVGLGQKSLLAAQLDNAALLAMWMLQSLLSAMNQLGLPLELQQQQWRRQQQQQQQCTTTPDYQQCRQASQEGEGAVQWESVLAAVAALLRHDGAGWSGPALQHLQAAGLQLSRELLAAAKIPNNNGGTSAAAAAEGIAAGAAAAAAAAAPGQRKGHAATALSAVSEWHQLVAALDLFFARSTSDPGSMAKRQVVKVACQLIRELALKMPQLLLPQQHKAGLEATHLGYAQGVISTVNSSKINPSNSSNKTAGLAAATEVDVLQLQRNLQLLSCHLSSRKLVRSCSGEELQEAVGDVLLTLQQLMLGA